jgi:peptidoglycan/LPS O-acetylase OafA/YrhL
MFHAGFTLFGGGYVGVDVFFVISGYLITTIILTEKEAGSFSIINFYERRARRILPALFFVVLACLPFAWLWMIPSQLKDFSDSLIAVSLFYSNILFWAESGYFEAAAELKPLLHTWSLAVEEQYYLLFPLFIVLFWRCGKLVIIATLVFVSAASLYLSQWGTANYPAATFYLLPTRIWELLLGSLTAFYLLYRKPSDGKTIITSVFFCNLISAIGLLMIVIPIFAYDKSTPFPGYSALAPTVGTALIILFGTARTPTGAFLSKPFFVGIGLISYSAYLWHQPLFAFARIKSLSAPNEITMLLLGALSLVLAYLSWSYIEKPFRNKEQFPRKIIFATSLTGMLLACSVGLVVIFNNGYDTRLTIEQKAVIAEIDKLYEERKKLVGSDICHYNNITHKGLQEFLSQWNCWDDKKSAPLTKLPIVVAGDSYSADIAVSLKENGYLPLQIGGADCSLDPAYMLERCTHIFNMLADRIKEDGYFKYLILGNHYSESELSLSSVSESIDYWEKLGLTIVWVSGAPEFYNFKKTALSLKHSEPDFKIARFSVRQELKNYLERRNVIVVDRRDIFCSLTDNCSYMDINNNLLVVDSGHLSARGAKMFGEELLKTPIFLPSVKWPVPQDETRL